MKAIKRLIINLIVLIAILSVAIIGGYIYVRSTYGIDLFNTAQQLKVLAKEVNEEELFTNTFNKDDFISMKTEINSKLSGLITYEEEKGYNGYRVDFSSLSGRELTNVISLTEKQVGALAQIVFYEKTGGKIKIEEKTVDISIIQVDFSEITEDGAADFNIVVKMDFRPFKADMNVFPYKYFQKYIPDFFYFSSTVTINKKENLGYTIVHKSLALNNLSASETADLFNTLNKVLKIGTLENLNMQIGSAAVNALIGNKENPGFTYSLKSIGATTFNFATVSGTDWFIIY